MNWLLTGRSVTPPKPRKRKQVPIKGKRFRVRGRRSVSIPHYDPLDPDSFDHDNPDSVITLDPSRLTAFNSDYAIQQLDWAELATTTAIEDCLDMGIRKGTLILFDTGMRQQAPKNFVVFRDGGYLRISAAPVDTSDIVIKGAVVFCFRSI